MQATRSERSGGTGTGTGRWLWRGILLCLAAAFFYALSLVVTAPARIVERFVEVPPSVTALGGTIWNGAAVMKGAQRVTWRVRRQESLFAFAPRFDVTVAGPDTQLAGIAQATPWRVTVEDLRGRAGWSVVRTLAPGIALDCTPLATVDLSEVLVSRAIIGAQGAIRTAAGTCDAPGLDPVPVPPLLVRATREGAVSRTVMTHADDDATTLAEAEIDGARWLRATVTPAGTRLVPGLPSGAPVMIEMELPALTGLLPRDR